MPKAGDCSSSGGGGRGSGDAKDLPLLFLRMSAAIALSVAGLFFSRLRSQRPRQLLLPPPSESDDSRGLKGGGGGLKEELRILKNVKASEEAERLRQENDKLAKEIEQLQTDRFADVEELVYLKWINACLRYELRNQEAPSGKTIARDLSKTLSPKSEQMAKQLILEYANVGVDERSLGPIEFDSEYSSSRASSGEPDDTSIDISLVTKHRNPKKKRFLSKLRKLVLGTDKENQNVPTLERKVSISSCSFDDFNGRESHDSYSSFMTETAVSTNQQHDYHSCGRHSFDSQRSSHLSAEAGDGRNEHPGVKNAAFGEGRLSELKFCHRGEVTKPEDVEIHKFAEALKTSRSCSRSSRRTSSFSS